MLVLWLSENAFSSFHCPKFVFETEMNGKEKKRNSKWKWEKTIIIHTQIHAEKAIFKRWKATNVMPCHGKRSKQQQQQHCVKYALRIVKTNSLRNCFLTFFLANHFAWKMETGFGFRRYTTEHRTEVHVECISKCIHTIPSNILYKRKKIRQNVNVKVFRLFSVPIPVHSPPPLVEHKSRIVSWSIRAAGSVYNV